jgi:hypothetical protein
MRGKESEFLTLEEAAAILRIPDVGDSENDPKDDNVGLPIDSHLIIPVIPRKKQNSFFLFIPVGFFLPLACMIFVITPKEDQNETEEVSLLSDLLYPQPEGKAAAEDLWEAGLSESSQSRK